MDHVSSSVPICFLVQYVRIKISIRTLMRDKGHTYSHILPPSGARWLSLIAWNNGRHGCSSLSSPLSHHFPHASVRFIVTLPLILNICDLPLCPVRIFINIVSAFMIFSHCSAHFSLQGCVKLEICPQTPSLKCCSSFS